MHLVIFFFNVTNRILMHPLFSFFLSFKNFFSPFEMKMIENLFYCHDLQWERDRMDHSSNQTWVYSFYLEAKISSNTFTSYEQEHWQNK